MKTAAEITTAIEQIFEHISLFEVADNARFIDSDEMFQDIQLDHLDYARAKAITELVLNPIGVAHGVEYAHANYRKYCEIDSYDAQELLQDLYDEASQYFSREEILDAKAGVKDTLELMEGVILHYLFDY